YCVFFFQAEDGIRDRNVTGVQTCALPIFFETRIRRNIKLAECPSFGQSIFTYAPKCAGAEDHMSLAKEVLADTPTVVATRVQVRSEERRVRKEGRWRWWADGLKREENREM